MAVKKYAKKLNTTMTKQLFDILSPPNHLLIRDLKRINIKRKQKGELYTYNCLGLEITNEVQE